MFFKLVWKYVLSCSTIGCLSCFIKFYAEKREVMCIVDRMKELGGSDNYLIT